LRGKWYLREQIGHGGDRNSKYQNDTLKGDTAERISKETGVSRPTIARDAQYAEAVDKIADALGEDARASILASEVRLTKQDIKQAAGLLDSAPDLFEQVKTGALSIPAAIKELRPHVANNSGNNEWYTPPEYIEAARAVMGGIDTDPASSAVANQTVKAGVYFDREYDGLRREWHGRLWLNPPYSQPEIGDFCAKLVAEIDGGRVRQAITLTNNATETGWFRVLAERCTAVCFPASRIRFLDAQGNANGAPLQGQAVMYFGNRTDMFAREFARFGLVFYAR
jgi:ParB family chromosome partitioning protein